MGVQRLSKLADLERVNLESKRAIKRLKTLEGGERRRFSRGLQVGMEE